MLYIENINDILPFIEDKPEFMVMQKDGYTVVDYNFNSPSTFDNEGTLECRGITFDANGNIIRRPLHKFFNVGEKKSISEIDWTLPHIVTEKRDGSMISPAIVNGEVRFMTRAGITDHSIRAEAKHLTSELAKKLRGILEWDKLTPIFEWTSPENRIVLNYDKDELTLLAMRNIVTGEYLHRIHLEGWSEFLDIPLVKSFDIDFNNSKSFDQVKNMEGIEGFVIHFPYTDEFYKIKTDEYSMLHRCVSYFETEDKILDVVLSGKVDDVIGAFSDDRKERLIKYSDNIWAELNHYKKIVEDVVSENMNLSRKDFALNVVSNYPTHLKSAFFSVLDGKDSLDVMKNVFYKNYEKFAARW